MSGRFLAGALALGVSILDAPLALADYASGLSAYNRGDNSAAFREFGTAAERGDADAQYMLGRLYATGSGTIQDYVLAHMWFNMAAAQGNRDAVISRDDLARQMTPRQLSQAQDMARQRGGGTQAAQPGRDEIMAAQRKLTALGYGSGRADGVMGEGTRQAIRRWQTDLGIPATGQLTPDVMSRLSAVPVNQVLGEDRLRSRGDLGEQVRIVQRELNKQGYSAGQVDGKLGAGTRTAIRAWQRDHGMRPNGEISTDLLAKLQSDQPTATVTTTIESLYPPEQQLAESGRLRGVVEEVQKELAQHGYYGGPESGSVNGGTRSAIRQYQADAGLAVNGQITPDLLDHLKFARPEIFRQQKAGVR